MPGKLIKQDYKIFALAQDSYVWYFQLASKHYRIAELERADKHTTTGSIVFQIAQLLPKFPNTYFLIYIDNYFISILLFSKL